MSKRIGEKAYKEAKLKGRRQTGAGGQKTVLEADEAQRILWFGATGRGCGPKSECRLNGIVTFQCNI